MTIVASLLLQVHKLLNSLERIEGVWLRLVEAFNGIGLNGKISRKVCSVKTIVTGDANGSKKKRLLYEIKG